MSISPRVYSHGALTDETVSLVVVYPLDGGDVCLEWRKNSSLEQTGIARSLTAYAAIKDPSQSHSKAGTVL